MNNPFQEIDDRLSRIEKAIASTLPSTECEKTPTTFLSIDQVAEITGYTRDYIYQLNSRGQIPVIITAKGSKLRFSRRAIEQWLAMGAPKDKLAVSEIIKSNLI